MNGLVGVLIAIFSVGGAGAVAALAKGINNWRAGAARTEARAIQNLEKYRDESDARANAESHRASYYHDLAEYWRDRAGNAEYKIRTTWGASEIPTPGPIPTFTPLALPTPGALTKDPDHEPD